MTMTRRHLLATSTAAASLAPFAAAFAAQAGSPAAGPVADAKLAALLDRFVEQMLTDSPETATSLGLDKGARAGLKSRLSGASTADRRAQVAAAADRVKRLSAIDPKSLNPHDLTIRDTVLAAQTLTVEGGAFSYGVDYANPYVVTQQSGAVSGVPEFLNSQHAVNTAADVDAYLARTHAFAKVLDQETARIGEDAGAGVIAPAFILDTAIAQLTELRGQAAGSTQLVASLAERAKAKGLADPSAAETKIVADEVFPALDRQLAALKAARAKATADAGVWKLPKGDEYYAWALRVGTTTTMSADQIHAMGLEQGAAIAARMDPILKAQGLTQGGVGERVTALTKDPRYLYPDSDAGRAQLLAYLEDRIAATRLMMPKLSRLGLKAEVRVKAVPKEIEAGAPQGYMNFAALDGSRPAIYYINLKDIGNWPKFTLPTLTTHEAIPGHAWQGAYLAERSSQIPLIASLMGFNAFIEGWALYAEQLADEGGFYDGDPLGQLGYLQAQQFRAARLVVDTGLHHKRWTREQAIDYLVTTTGRARPAMTSEVDRYCANPGQACGYKVGHTEIVRLREMAKAKMGGKFDLRDFNDAVVSTGGVPLTVLAEVVDRYVAG
ncbi:hypothetical protein ASD38_21760 [Caulobacter sp. Root487D2Y]|uniref:DUF885 domain-containing protein n=1 Tax=Caulobacter sp. Root487D2Y TaxID=1736547 RepID=UPI0006FD69A6|nr:DUF885 family protein [Caulobacter sp. Root487D2Y]KQY34367.1 hypothetical protein ASD38_21760 [Caulobacter sp. Root487D2Y]